MQMKIFPRRAAVAIAAAMAVIGALGVTSATPALAQQPGFCTNFNGTAVCLNDWFGSTMLGTPIKTWNANKSYEDFYEADMGRCGGLVTATCPFTNHALDNAYKGFPIVQLVYQNPNIGCVSTDVVTMDAALGNCNQPNGSGGDYGTLFVDHNGFMINVYWSNQDSYATCMQGLGPGTLVYLAEYVGDGCEQWAET